MSCGASRGQIARDLMQEMVRPQDRTHQQNLVIRYYDVAMQQAQILPWRHSCGRCCNQLSHAIGNGQFLLE
jgi:hypothetical protein